MWWRGASLDTKIARGLREGLTPAAHARTASLSKNRHYCLCIFSSSGEDAAAGVTWAEGGVGGAEGGAEGGVGLVADTQVDERCAQ